MLQVNLDFSQFIEGKSIDVFNHGNMQRDFTYIVEGMIILQKEIKIGME